MNTYSNEKRNYKVPEIACIELDKDISLALQSSPPNGPAELGSIIKLDNFSVQPFEYPLS